MVTACRDHVTGRVVRWASDHFPDKVHLSGRNHVSYAGDGIKHAAYFAIAQTLFLYCCHRDLENASDASVEEYL